VVLMSNTNKLTVAQVKALRMAAAAAPASIGCPEVSKATLFALQRQRMLIATYTPFHSATDRPSFRISNRGRAFLAQVDSQEPHHCAHDTCQWGK
jgi:hypothetical protein